jgi:peptidoglycan/xylan/chitin deacetylase (PgdA/CDA1 family)
MRRQLKTVLGSARSRRPGRGVVALTYHRVGGGSPDERDVSMSDFAAQVDALRQVDVVPLDTALDRLADDDDPRGTVITIDDGFRDIYENAWPMLRRHRLPFTLYLTTAYVGGTMDWPGSTARSPGRALTWGMVREMVDSGLCTLGNHTHTHVPAEALTTGELDTCTEVIREQVGVEARHFAYPWGVIAPDMEHEVTRRFRSAMTGRVGRNTTGVHPWRLDRVPVRRTDPPSFFRAKLTGSLGPELAYAGTVRAAKAVGIRG